LRKRKIVSDTVPTRHNLLPDSSVHKNHPRTPSTWQNVHRQKKHIVKPMLHWESKKKNRRETSQQPSTKNLLCFTYYSVGFFKPKNESLVTGIKPYFNGSKIEFVIRIKYVFTRFRVGTVYITNRKQIWKSYLRLLAVV